MREWREWRRMNSGGVEDKRMKKSWKGRREGRREGVEEVRREGGAWADS
jgi:hypothetical protein